MLCSLLPFTFRERGTISCARIFGREKDFLVREAVGGSDRLLVLTGHRDDVLVPPTAGEQNISRSGMARGND